MVTVLRTDEFEEWLVGLTEGEQTKIAASILLLQNLGVNLRYPHTTGIKGAKTDHLRELRIQYAGNPYRVLYAFDPKRRAVLLIGGAKLDDRHFYSRYVPIADRLYAEHIGQGT